jgi:ferrochelatase
MKEAVLLINLGTPDDPSTGKVRKYLTQFLNDRRVIDISAAGRFALVNFLIVPFRSPKSARLYKHIWTREGSPLLRHGVALKEALQKHLGDRYIVELGMRYQKPSIAAALENLRQQRPSKIHVIPLYPQYASSSTGSTIEEVMRCIKGWEVIPDLNIVSKFYDDPNYLSALTAVAKRYRHEDYDHVLFSYHGLPERQILKASAHYGGDTCRLGACCNTITKNNQYCYRANCMATTRELVKALQIPEGKYTSSFQSRLNDKWLQPFSDKVVEELAKNGAKKLLVFSAAFVADCLETTYEIGTEYQEIFHKHGGAKITLVESLNAQPVWVEALSKMVKV